MKPIFHIASCEVWDAARVAGSYESDSLAADGFVHCSFTDQVARVANEKFRGQEGLVVLEIDADLIDAEIRLEDLYGLDEDFPHVYGAIPEASVVRVHEFVPDADGSFSFP